MLESSKETSSGQVWYKPRERGAEEVTTTPDFEVQVHGDAQIDHTEREYARRKVARVAQRTRRPILFAKVDLHAEANPSRSRPAVAKAVLDVNGSPVRAHVRAPTLHEAIDLLEDRLLHRLEHMSHR
jgi:ribosome-associated translation inhibitor RaiA